MGIKVFIPDSPNTPALNQLFRQKGNERSFRIYRSGLQLDDVYRESIMEGASKKELAGEHLALGVPNSCVNLMCCVAGFRTGRRACC
jgi:hypothetical protein